jgi:gliding motility-associated-like protein
MLATRNGFWITFLTAIFTILGTLESSAQAYPPIKLTIGNACNFKGAIQCVDFRVDGCTQVPLFNFFISYDPTIIKLVQPVSLSSSQIPGIDATVFTIYENFPGALYGPGNINFLYYEGNPLNIPVGGNLFTLCFEIIGEPGEMTPIIINNDKFKPEVLQIDPSNPTTDIAADFQWMNGSIKVKANAITITSSVCNASNAPKNNGNITFIPTGGTGPYSYTVNSGAPVTNIADGTSVVLSNLSIGAYTIAITDALGVTTSKVINVSDGLPVIYTTDVKDPTCFHNPTQNGEIGINITDGGAHDPANYRFAWSNFEFNTNRIEELGTGRYTVTITDPAGCRILDTFDIAATPLNFEVVVTDALCKGIKDGVVEVRNMTGGIGTGYVVNFEGLDKMPGQTVFTGLDAGFYRVRFKDAAPCNSPEQIVEVKYQRTHTFDLITTDIGCNRTRGLVEVTATPTELNYQFILNSGLPFINFAEPNIYKNDTLRNGNYTLLAIDQNGCRNTLMFDIKDGDPVYIDADVVQPGCSTNGSITLNPKGGSGGYTYNWNPSQAGNPSSLSGLTGGTFRVTVTDSDGCSKDTTMILNNIGSLAINLSKTDITCAGKTDGTATVTVQTANMITIQWRDPLNNIIPQGTNTISNLSPGTYTVLVTDQSNCSATGSITIVAPPPLAITMTATQPKCFGDKGVATITNLGGVSNPQFAWTRSGTPGLILSTSNVLTADPGIYLVKITYGSGCTKDTSITFNAPVKPVINTVLTNNVTCFGGSDGRAAISNSPSIVSQQWSNGTNQPFALGLVAGGYWVIGTDNNGCKTDTFKFIIGQSPKLMLDEAFTDAVNPTCFGSTDGSIEVQAIGGTVTTISYRYTWINPAGPTTKKITGLGAGSYIVQVTDQNNCEHRDTIVLNQPNELVAAIDRIKTVDLDCNNVIDGRIAISTTGGNPGIKTVAWQAGVQSVSGIAFGLGPGTYCAMVSDNFGCRDTICYTLSAPEKLSGMVALGDPIQCFGGSTCIKIDNVTGGTGNKYTFQINNQVRYPIDSCVTIAAGSYLINIIDSAGCSISTLVDIPQPNPVSINVGPDLEFSLGATPLIINATTSQPTVLTSLVWTPMDNIDCITDNCQSISAAPVVTTTYTLLVTDVNGCTGQDELTIKVNDARNVFFANAFSPNRDGYNDYFQVITGLGVDMIMTFDIYDRWGNQVFTKENYLPDPVGTDGWDGSMGGKRLDPGVYVYTATVRFVDGKIFRYKGSVTLIDKIRN